MKLTKSTILYADGHIKHAAWAERPYIVGDSLAALDEIIQLCVKTQSSLTILGDALDSKKIEADTFGQLYQRLDLMRTHGLPVFAIHGNHDGGSVPWMASLPTDMVQYVDLKFFEPAEGLRMFGIGYRTQSELQPLLADLPADATTLAMHQCVKQVLKFKYNMDLDWLPNQVRTVYIGDMHAHLELTHNGMTVVSPGSPHITEISANPDRVALIVTKDSVTRHRLRRRAVARIKVPLYERPSIATLLDECRSAIRTACEHPCANLELKPILHVQVPHACSLEYAPAFDLFQSDPPAHIWFDSYSTLDTGELTDTGMPVVEDDMGEVDFRGVLNSMDGSDAAKELLWALVTAIDKQAVFEAARKKALEG